MVRKSIPKLLAIFISMFLLNACVQYHAKKSKDDIIQPVFDISKCVVIGNKKIKVVIDPSFGGRIIEYSLEGKNILYSNKKNPNWVFPEGDKYMGPAGGRFDIGPEETIPEHLELWQGKWEVKEKHLLSVKLISRKSNTLGIQLMREFKINDRDSSLSCTQTIINLSSERKSFNHWTRTFAKGGGICVVPLSGNNRFKKNYLLHTSWPKFQIITRPSDPGIIEKDSCILIKGPPFQPKVGIESYAGWFAYLHPSNLLFVKEFPVYPKRRYGGVTGSNVDFFFFKDVLVELESLGPEEEISPGGSVSYYEKWSLIPFPFSDKVENVDIQQVKKALINFKTKIKKKDD